MRRWQINSSNTCWAVIWTPSSSLLDTKVKQTRIRKLTTHLLLALLRALEPSAWEHLSVGAGGKMGTFWDRVINCLAIFTAAFESSLTTSNKFAYNSCETINSPKMAFSALCRQPQCSLYMFRRAQNASGQKRSSLSHSGKWRAERDYRIHHCGTLLQLLLWTLPS